MICKEACIVCGELAIWAYGPKAGSYCDNCVPRGCSCNFYPVSEDSEELIEERDEQGRRQPCCEYIFNTDGFDIE